MVNILIVEDEKPISDMMRLSLTKAGFRCTCVYDGSSALESIGNKCPDLILLDIMLPEVDGFEILQHIHPLKVPVIFITAKGSLEDRVKGLKMGAEDYIVKPFEIIEMLARVEVVLRRYGMLDNQIKIDDILIDTDSMRVSKNDEEIILTNKEYSLLLLFVQNVNLVLYRDVIYERVWGGDYPSESRTVDLHIQRMRKKLGWEQKLVSIRGIGYRLEV